MSPIQSSEEFLRRFVQHVLPRGFVKVRHYGLLANAQREAKLTQCRRLLLVLALLTLPAAPGPEAAALPSTLTPAREPACPHCGSKHIERRPLAPDHSRPRPPADTS